MIRDDTLWTDYCTRDSAVSHSSSTYVRTRRNGIDLAYARCNMQYAISTWYVLRTILYEYDYVLLVRRTYDIIELSLLYNILVGTRKVIHFHLYLYVLYL